MERYKYPRSMHFWNSPGLQNDDRMLQSYDGLVGHEVVLTEKLDGENTTFYHDYLHARSIDGRHHPSRDWVKSFHGRIAHLLSPDIRVCGENMYAKHSIHYNELESYFYGFSVWENDMALSWDDTLQWFEMLDIVPVPTLYRGKFSVEILQQVIDKLDPVRQEGLVCRVTAPIWLDEFSDKLAKWVRKGHVQTTEHWMQQEVIPNILRIHANSNSKW